MSDIVTSVLPHWTGTRAWILSRPLTGFSETFSQYIMEVMPGGGSDRPEPDARAQAVLFVVAGTMTVELNGKVHDLRAGSFAYLPAAPNGRCVPPVLSRPSSTGSARSSRWSKG